MRGPDWSAFRDPRTVPTNQWVVLCLSEGPMGRYQSGGLCRWTGDRWLTEGNLPLNPKVTVVGWRPATDGYRVQEVKGEKAINQKTPADQGGHW